MDHAPEPDRDINLPADIMQIGLDVARVGLGTVDYRRNTVNLDPLVAGLFDLPAHTDVLRSDLHARIHPDDWPDVEHEVDALLDPARPDVIDLTHRVLLPDGTVRWVHVRKRVSFETRDPGASPDRGIFAVVDVTAQKQAELRAEMLIGELNHRAKNLITVIIGITRQLDRESDPARLAERLIERLMVLARNQDALTGNAEGVFDMRQVLDHQLRPFRDAHSARITLDVPAQILSPGTAQIVAMATHELLTNAVKYGALSGPEGNVRIAWDITGDQGHFSWIESGGPAVTAPERTGFGSQVVRSLIEVSLDADVTLEYPPEGVRYTFTAPMDRIAEG